MYQCSVSILKCTICLNAITQFNCIKFDISITNIFCWSAFVPVLRLEHLCNERGDYKLIDFHAWSNLISESHRFNQQHIKKESISAPETIFWKHLPLAACCLPPPLLFQLRLTFAVEVVPMMLPLVKTYNRHNSCSIIPAKAGNKAGLHVRKMCLQESVRFLSTKGIAF